MNKQIFKLSILFATLIMLFIACGPASDDQATKKEIADLVLINGNVVTLDQSVPTAQAVAIRGDRIVAVGDSQKINAYISKKTNVIDVKGKLVIPAFIESHGHFSSLGYAKMQLDLTKAGTWDEVVQMTADAVKKAKPGQWIQGRGWHQEKWTEKPQPNVDGLPLHLSLSNVSPDNPVWLRHASGHAGFANAKAMELAGVDKDTQNPQGGEIVRDEKGNPIGVFRETASALINTALNAYRSGMSAQEKETEMLMALELAQKTCLENGIATFQDAGVSFQTVDVFKKLAEENKLDVRLNVMLSESNQNLQKHIADYRIIGMGNNHLTVRAVKRLIDGALGSHGAWLLEPYDSMPSSTGLNTEPIAAMKETARIAAANGFQLCTHAIGDRGNRETLDIYEETFKNNPDKKDLRWRIEHAQHIHPDDVARFAQLKVIAAMQGIHCTSDGPWVIKRLGEKRAEANAYVWRKLLKQNVIICNGTDVPVEDVSPIASYYATISRKMKNGDVFYGNQKMTRQEALQSYTINGAYASFQEQLTGTLTPGKLADMTVLSKDILTVAEDEVPQTDIVYTIVGGKVLYSKL